MARKLAITGAGGFIGANLAARLRDERAGQLLLVDDPPTLQRPNNLSEFSDCEQTGRLPFREAVEGDRLDLAAIFHLGAISDTTAADWNTLVENNIRYSQALWHYAARHQIPFLYASSGATYGNGSRGFSDRTPPEALQPLNLYGRSKNEFDRWALAEVKTRYPTPPRWAGLKFFNVYGPREGHKGRMASMVWHSYQQIQREGRVRLFRSTHPDYADGGQRRDFVHVDDCVDHMLWLWQHEHPGGLYNSATGSSRTFHELAEATFAALGREPEIEYIDMPVDIAPNYQNFTEAQMTKLRAAGYPRDALTLEQGVRRYVDWLRVKVEAG